MSLTKEQLSILELQMGQAYLNSNRRLISGPVSREIGNLLSAVSSMSPEEQVSVIRRAVPVLVAKYRGATELLSAQHFSDSRSMAIDSGISLPRRASILRILPSDMSASLIDGGVSRTMAGVAQILVEGKTLRDIGPSVVTQISKTIQDFGRSLANANIASDASTKVTPRRRVRGQGCEFCKTMVLVESQAEISFHRDCGCQVSASFSGVNPLDASMVGTQQLYEKALASLRLQTVERDVVRVGSDGVRTARTVVDPSPTTMANIQAEMRRIIGENTV